MRVWLIFLFPILLLLTGCTEIRSNDPIKIYKYWSGVNPTEDLELTHGQYWQSSHSSKEYIMFLELNPSKKWWTDFLFQNNLKLDTTYLLLPSERPNWFSPNLTYLRYKGVLDFDHGSRYYRDTLTGKCLIYEISFNHIYTY